jgi:macrolide transport system ATP-binding/permease protein
MNEARVQVQSAAALCPLIEFKDVCKTFVTSGGVEVNALRGISLSIYPGEFVAIVGTSGSGKTTLMNILGCLDRPTGGEYFFNGQDVSEFDRDKLAWLRREAFGFVFQSYNLIGTATAQENVEVPAVYAGKPRAERKARAAELLSRLGLAERLDHRPNQLSGGQQQRVSIARALMNGGQILLADEPTGALDSKSGREVMELLRSLAEDGHTIIVITHDRQIATQADRTIELLDGEIVSDSGEVVPSAPPHGITLGNEHDATATTLLADGSEAVRMAVNSLKTNLFRTTLTLLGIMIGVGAVVAMLAVGEGAKQAVLDRISSFGTNLLMVRPGAEGSRSFGMGTRTLYPEDAKAIAQIEGVKAVMPENSMSVTARYGNHDYQTTATGTSAAMPEARNWPVARGTFFTDQDETTYAAVAVLGQTVIDNLFPDGTNPIGKYVLLNNVPFLVIGTLTAKGASGFGRDQDDVIYVPLSTGALRLWGDRSVRMINVECTSTSVMSATEERIREVLLARHGTEDFRINNSAEFLQAATETQDTMTVLLGSIAAISLLVGGIGVMNIMLVSVTERTREIGIRMATGARTRNILQQFLTEAMVVSALGGVIGLLAGIGVAMLIGAFGQDVKFTAGPMILAFSCAAVTGLVFGFAPALKAARLDPVVALSSE